MNLKLKALGLGLVAAMGIGAFAGVDATAETGGHFVSSVSHTIVRQTSSEGSLHRLAMILHGLEGEFICDVATAEGTAGNATETEVVGTTKLEKCHTAGTTTTVTILVNGCTGRATVAKGTTNETEQTDHLVCPPGKSIIVQHPNCEVTIPPQTIQKGFTYTAKEEQGHEVITLDANVEFGVQFHSGICVFLGTSHTGTIKGSTIVRGLNTAGEVVNITAT